jgi:hypothetical protein
MAKTVNYTPEMEKAIRDALTGEVDQKSAVTELAETLGKTVASVRQKAVRMGLYKKPEYISKNGKKAEAKADIVANIAEALNVNIEVAESLEKANKNILLKIREALAE